VAARPNEFRAAANAQRLADTRKLVRVWRACWGPLALRRRRPGTSHGLRATSAKKPVISSEGRLPAAEVEKPCFEGQLIGECATKAPGARFLRSASLRDASVGMTRFGASAEGSVHRSPNRYSFAGAVRRTASPRRGRRNRTDAIHAKTPGRKGSPTDSGRQPRSREAEKGSATLRHGERRGGTEKRGQGGLGGRGSAVGARNLAAASHASRVMASVPIRCRPEFVGPARSKLVARSFFSLLGNAPRQVPLPFIPPENEAGASQNPSPSGGRGTRKADLTQSSRDSREEGPPKDTKHTNAVVWAGCRHPASWLGSEERSRAQALWCRADTETELGRGKALDRAAGRAIMALTPGRETRWHRVSTSTGLPVLPGRSFVGTFTRAVAPATPACALSRRPPGTRGSIFVRNACHCAIRLPRRRLPIGGMDTPCNGYFWSRRDEAIHLQLQPDAEGRCQRKSHG
jgi:hypothetical protein